MTYTYNEAINILAHSILLESIEVHKDMFNHDLEDPEGMSLREIEQWMCNQSIAFVHDTLEQRLIDVKDQLITQFNNTKIKVVSINMSNPDDLKLDVTIE